MYRSHGIHWCLNLTCGPPDLGAAVLIRGVEPLEGVEVMRRRRRGVPDRRLADGPGKLGQAFAIDGAVDGMVAAPQASLRLEGRHDDADARVIGITARIGVTRAADWPLRFVLEPRQ